MNFISFSSGSSGNCYYITAQQYGLIIDLGIGIRKFKKYYKDYGFIFPEIKGILVTHEHADHIKAVGILANELRIPVYATELVHRGMIRNIRMQKKVESQYVRPFEHDTTIEIGPFRVTSFKTPHDSTDNSGYFIQYRDTNLCIITDAGHFNDSMKHYIQKSINLVIEANYDKQMLEQGPYPAYLKHRIKSENGHMCNEELAQYLSENVSPQIQHIWLCHLSEENNSPEKAQQTIVNAFKEKGWTGEILKNIEPLNRKMPSKVYQL